MAFSATWFLLEQEGLLAQACLCNGLTALRRANLGDKKGLFYSAFFELSIGFERVLKLVLILDHMARNKLVPPDSKTVEDYGHKLRSIFDATKAVCATHGVTALDAFQADSLPFCLFIDIYFCFGLNGWGPEIGQSRRWHPNAPTAGMELLPAIGA